MKKIKNIIFDLGVVLVNLDRQACIDAFKLLGISDLENLTSVSGHTGIFGEYEKGDLTTPEFY
ncbi:MAG: HAD family hydrolase, partial [Bacteroidales bacterium]